MHTFGLEAISRQGDAFFKELTSAVTEAVKKFKSSDPDIIEEDLKAMSAIIKHHTNLTVTPSIGLFGPAIGIPDLYRRSAVRSPYNDYLQNADLQRKLWESNGAVVGKVDFKNGYVDGFYANVPFVMYMPIAIFKRGSGFTAEEIAAIMLHEVGHAFICVALLAHTTVTTFLMNFISNNWISATPKEREHWLISINRTRGENAIDVAELAKVDDVKVVEVVIISVVNDAMRSELGYSYYEIVAFESMADNYATRYGAGRALATALDKYHFASIQKRNLNAYLILELFKILPFILPSNFLIDLWKKISNKLISFDFGCPLYDSPFDRIRRIRMAMIDDIKDFEMSNSDKEMALNEIKRLDEILTTTKDRRQFIALVLEKISFTEVAKRRRGAEFYRELEMLASSNLYVRSAELDLLKGK